MSTSLTFVDCQQNHSKESQEAVQQVDFSQRNQNGRHRCAACAYEHGVAVGIEEGKRLGKLEAQREMCIALGIEQP